MTHNQELQCEPIRSIENPYTLIHVGHRQDRRKIIITIKKYVLSRFHILRLYCISQLRIKTKTRRFARNHF